MNKNLKQFLKRNRLALENSNKTLADIYKIMFSCADNILCETNDGFRISKTTYSQMDAKIKRAAAGLFEKIGATHNYVGVALDNSPNWIVAFWAVLMSGNKPYLINLRYPTQLTCSILKTLNIEHVVCDKDYHLGVNQIYVDSLDSDFSLDGGIFEDELAFSSSATSMNEVICFYSGKQIAEQILNFRTIVKSEPRIAKHYKGCLKQLAFLPFYHVFGLFAVYFWFTFFGRTLVFLRDYSSDTILNTCRRHQVTHIFAVPVLWHTIEKKIIASAKEQGDKKYQKLLKGIKKATTVQNILPSSIGAEVAKWLLKEVTDKVFGRSVMFCINGGSYIKQSALELLNGIGYSTYNGYGMSEIGITSVELRRKPKYRNQNSIGMPFDSVEYKISDDGILYVKGSSLCVKKLVNGKEQVLDEWFCTNDNMVCKNNHYFILGRKSDMIIGENGENINPDTIEKLFSIPFATAFSVLGLGPDDAQELSIVIEVNEYVTSKKLEQIKSYVYSVNDTLQGTLSIKKFYFTTDELCPPTAIKISRAQLKKKIEDSSVNLIPFADMKVNDKEGSVSVFAAKVREIIADVLNLKPDDIGDTAHIFYDLGATSIQYFDVLTRLSEVFSVTDYKQNDKYCYTVTEICEYLEKHV